MLFVAADAVLVWLLSIGLLLALAAVLVLVLVSLRKPSDAPLLTAAGLVVACLVVTSIVPLNVPMAVGIVLALLGTTAAVVGGDPITRRLLDIATHGRVREGVAGGILVEDAAGTRDDEPQEVMRGGAVIGYLERIAVVAGIVAGYPEAIAVVVAVKGVGRFSELATPATRERFIVGTLASLVWACAVGALVRLAIW